MGVDYYNCEHCNKIFAYGYGGTSCEHCEIWVCYDCKNECGCEDDCEIELKKYELDRLISDLEEEKYDEEVIRKLKEALEYYNGDDDDVSLDGDD